VVHEVPKEKAKVKTVKSTEEAVQGLASSHKVPSWSAE
jgi:hypothetical protein